MQTPDSASWKPAPCDAKRGLSYLAATSAARFQLLDKAAAFASNLAANTGLDPIRFNLCYTIVLFYPRHVKALYIEPVIHSHWWWWVTCVATAWPGAGGWKRGSQHPLIYQQGNVACSRTQRQPGAGAGFEPSSGRTFDNALYPPEPQSPSD